MLGGCSKMVMEWSPVMGTVQEFIDYSLLIVGIMIIYYLIKFFALGGKTKEEKEREAEAFRTWVKEKWDTGKKAKREWEEKKKKEKERAEAEARKRTEEAKKEREEERKRKEKENQARQRDQTKAFDQVKGEVTFYLLAVVELIGQAIKEIEAKNPGKARRLITKAKRRMSQVVGSKVFEKLARSPAHQREAEKIGTVIGMLRLEMDRLSLTEKSWRDFNVKMGALHQEIGQLIREIFK